jgi:hypothetical protein
MGNSAGGYLSAGCDRPTSLERGICNRLQKRRRFKEGLHSQRPDLADPTAAVPSLCYAVCPRFRPESRAAVGAANRATARPEILPRLDS